MENENILENSLKGLDTNLNAYKFKQAYSKADRAGRCNGFFEETDFRSIPEAKDSAHFVNVSPFLGANID